MEVLNVKRYTLGVHIWDLTLEDVFRVGDHLKNYIFIGDMLYFFGIMFTKLSILMLYLRIFQPNKKFRYFTYVMITFNVVYLLLFFLLYAFECNPPALGWHTVTWTGGGTCIDTIKVSYAVGGINVFSDLVILVMPIPLLLKLNLKKSQKLGLLAIFATGTFTVACTIVRQVVIMKTLRDFDHGFSTVEEIVWLTVELCVGIICACLPTLAPLYHLRLWARLVPQSVRIYLLSLRTATHGSTTYGSSKMSAKPSGGQSYESDVELVDNGKVSTHVGTHMPTMELVHTDPRRIYRMTDMEVSYSKHRDASNHV
ncbi:hypothetical protein EPUS_06469 [Endocarpon pusillum Z07020]|uniref:Rhodopsin domain-containing protein n=1 Tax=Endocarpon pusillum (strain Z07020 / HMAS-L-300199) TaxID=1263415 RepID=U1I4Y9_ENDPU|nr:uncharacterized protein EPUS_06469 [Endocarpon pusillum Z07020]ERF77189.1 hypothetical protein EPUS_06469 [Endocarpon pusillum Z07020]